MWAALLLLAAPAAPAEPIKIGLLGLDSSHTVAFTSLLNDPSRPDHIPGTRVVAAFKGGSADVESSAKRVDGFTNDLRDKWKVQIADSVEQVLKQVDVVIISAVDGRAHLPFARAVFAAKKRVFIDKPLAAGYADSKEIAQLARKSGTPFFTSSALRYIPEMQALPRDPKLGGPVLGAFTYGPAPTEPHHADLFWYGIHAVEMLFTVMGPGCVSVSRGSGETADVVIGRWSDGRLGTMRGNRDGTHHYGAIAFGAKGAVHAQPAKIGYQALLAEIVKFFQTGKPPVSPEETLQIMAFMQAADLSKERHGVEVRLDELDRK